MELNHHVPEYEYVAPAAVVTVQSTASPEATASAMRCASVLAVLKDHVMEKKWKVDPPREPDGVDMWMPVALDFTYPMDIDTGPASPTYMP